MKEHYVSIRKKWSTDTCYNINEPCKHYAELKNPDIKEYTLYESTYMKGLKSANTQRQKVD